MGHVRPCDRAETTERFVNNNDEDEKEDTDPVGDQVSRDSRDDVPHRHQLREQMFDGDPAGTKAAATLHKRIASGAKVVIASVPQGLDPDDLSDLELRRLLSIAGLTIGS